MFDYGQQLLARLSSLIDLGRSQRNALHIFDQATQNAGTFLAFMPQSPVASSFKSVAPSLISNVGRSLMENYLAIEYYLRQRAPELATLESLIEDQFVDVQRIQMVCELNPDNPEVDALKQAVDARKANIRACAAFSTLNPQIANNCENGFSDRTLTKAEILQLRGIKGERFWSSYQHFSTFLHSNAFAADQLSAMGQETDQTIEFLRVMTMDIVGFYSLNVLALSYGSKIPQAEVPLNIQDTLLFWQGYFKGERDVN